MNYIYEVEQFILNEIEIIHGKKLKKLILTCPVEKRRIAMFAAIHTKKDSELTEMIKQIKSTDRISELDKIIERIRKYNPISEIEKNSFGEIFTPFSLINDILDTLPSDVWSNPNLKWGDFCNGVGNFMIIIIKRLMIGLEKSIPDQNKRYKHIIEEMIFVAELQIKNMFFWMVSIDPKSEFKLNLYRGNSLEKEFAEHMRDVWKREKMDIMVSNPPYQEQKEGNKKTQPLWHLFVSKYISLLSKGGYMAIVHPSGWRNVDGVFKKTQEILKSKEMIYLKMHSFRDGQETFNAAINYDYYCLRNSKNNNFLTKIIFEDLKEFNINISELEFLPNESFDEILKLIAKSNEEKVKIIHSFSAYETRKTYMSKIKTNEFKYPCVYTIKSPDKGNIPTFYYSSLKDKGHFNIPKIICGNGATGVYIDKNGEYGLTQFAFGLIDDVENLEHIKKALQTEKFIRNIMGFKNSLGDKYNKKILATFRKDFWKDFLTEKECSYSRNKKTH